jgi:hypothetical protein
MTDIICPLCGKPNPPDLEECKYCQAPLKTGGFVASPEGDEELTQLFSSPEEKDEEEKHPEEPTTQSNLEEAIPDWLKKTEASFLEKSEDESEEPVEESVIDEFSEQLDALLAAPTEPASPSRSAIDDKWLASLLTEAGVNEPSQTVPEQEKEAESFEVPSEEPLEEHPQEEDQPEARVFDETGEEAAPEPAEPEQKPEWLTNLEAASNLKLEGGVPPSQAEPQETPAEEVVEEEEPEQATPPEWLTKSMPEEIAPPPEQSEGEIAPAELPGWLEALRPSDTAAAPTGPVEDVSGEDIVTAGPLVGLRGVISAHPSAIKARKPPTYSIKLRVTDEQKARVEMMQELLADEGKPTPLPSPAIISSRNIFRLIVAAALLLPIILMIITKSQNSSTPQPGSIPGVEDFSQQIQRLPTGASVLMAFDYEAGFSGEMNLAISNVISQLIKKSTYLTVVATNPSGPALAESIINDVYSQQVGSSPTYPYYADLGYIPGGTLGLLGLASSPRSVVPYALNGYNVWTSSPLNTISKVEDFNAVIVLTNDADTARIWIEQIGTHLQVSGTPLLFVTSAQAAPMILPYYQGIPSQVQGLIAGLAGGVAYGRSIGNVQQNGVWDAYSVGVTISILVILIGSIAGGVLKYLGSDKKENL